MSLFASRDPRLALPWYHLTMPTGAVWLVSPLDARQDKSGLGVADGVQSYRDGLGRRYQVPVAYFTAHSRRVARGQVAAALPELALDVAAKRFPAPPVGLLERLGLPSRPVARPVAKARATKGKPAPRRPTGLGPNVAIRVLRKSRATPESGVN